MQPNYSQSRPYGKVTYSLNRRRQILDAMLADLYQRQENWIEQALAVSDLSQARAVIEHIKSL